MSRRVFTRSYTGFTIVEVAVIVTVIAILSALIYVAYDKVKIGAEDNDREADITAIQNALERYYDKNGEYPSNAALNPSNAKYRLPNFTAVKTALPGIQDTMLKGPGDYEFMPLCEPGGSCVYDSNANETYDYWRKTYIYNAWYASNPNTPSSAFNMFMNPTVNGKPGWGCILESYYADPGYVMAWYSESEKLWKFKKGNHGNINTANVGGGPVAPQTCTFS